MGVMLNQIQVILKPKARASVRPKKFKERYFQRGGGWDLRKKYLVQGRYGYFL